MAKKKFPDLTGDGKVTQADILKGRGVKNLSGGGKINNEPTGEVRGTGAATKGIRPALIR